VGGSTAGQAAKPTRDVHVHLALAIGEQPQRSRVTAEDNGVGEVHPKPHRHGWPGRVPVRSQELRLACVAHSGTRKHDRKKHSEALDTCASLHKHPPLLRIAHPFGFANTPQGAGPH
jgi:hypothetical protein